MTRQSLPTPRRGRIAWIMLDWAASGFSTVLITLVVAYVEKLVFATGGWGVSAGVIWAWTLAAAMLASAVSVPWARAADDAGRFRSRAELDEIYSFVKPGDNTIAYCRIGERSSHTWFVLTHLLGIPGVRNYDGSWTEWGNAVRAPVATGAQPGSA